MISGLKFSRLLLWLLPGLLLTVAGCSAPSGDKLKWHDAAVDLSWPVPPEQPRIRLLRTFAPSDFLQSDSKKERFFTWLTGDREQIAPLVLPYGVAADGEGLIWVTDTGLPGVHVFDLADREVRYILAADEEKLLSPVGVTYDPERQRLYVSDSELKRVFSFDREGRLRGKFAPPAGFERPAGMALDPSGRLHVVDVLRGAVEVFSPEGVHVGTLEGFGPEQRMNRPTNLDINGAGEIFVNDSMNFRVNVFSPTGDLLRSFGGIGDVPGTFSRPRGLALDSQGHVYVSDAAFDNIQVFDSDGRLLIYFGSAGTKPGQFNLPAGLFFDQQDRLYAVDAYNRRLQIFQYLRDK